MKRARVEVTLPSHDEIKKLWFNAEGVYAGPGKKGLPHCTDCHQWKFEHRYQHMVLHIPNPPQSHVCPSKCSGFESCPTRWKDGHPEVLEQERKEKEAHQLSTPRIRDRDQCALLSQHPDGCIAQLDVITAARPKGLQSSCPPPPELRSYLDVDTGPEPEQTEAKDTPMMTEEFLLDADRLDAMPMEALAQEIALLEKALLLRGETRQRRERLAKLQAVLALPEADFNAVLASFLAPPSASKP